MVVHTIRLEFASMIEVFLRINDTCKERHGLAPDIYFEIDGKRGQYIVILVAKREESLGNQYQEV
jgi:hypothetical protein